MSVIKRKLMMMMNDSTWQVLHRGDHYPRRLCTRKQYLHRVTTVRTGSWTPYALTPNTVELIPTLGALYPRGGPGQDTALTQEACNLHADRRSQNNLIPFSLLVNDTPALQGYLAHKKTPTPLGPPRKVDVRLPGKLNYSPRARGRST